LRSSGGSSDLRTVAKNCAAEPVSNRRAEAALGLGVRELERALFLRLDAATTRERSTNVESITERRGPRRSTRRRRWDTTDSSTGADSGPCATEGCPARHVVELD
jgi:hypothetical protein